MIIALKITADIIALSGECKPIIFKACKAGIEPINKAGTIAKYLATSFAIEKVVSVPRVINNCLPISTISISLVGHYLNRPCFQLLLLLVFRCSSLQQHLPVLRLAHHLYHHPSSQPAYLKPVRL